MNGSSIVIFLFIQRYESIRIFNTIYKVGTPLYHTLIYQFLERFVFTNHSFIEKELIPETTINKMTGSMFGSPYIEVYITPILIVFLRYQSFIVVRVHISQIISRRTCKSRHGAQFQRIMLFCFPIFSTT